MRGGRRLRMAVDGAMTLLLLLLMAFMVTGQAVHEWLGAAELALFIVHHVLNARWLTRVGRGRYSPVRILQTVLAALVLLTMLGAMASGIWMSRYAFGFLRIRRGMALAQRVHMLCVYWGFLALSAHLGLHWSGLAGVIRKAAGIKASSGARTVLLRLLALGAAGYGGYAFRKHRLADYLFLKSEFVFFDFSQSPAQFLAEYIAMMVLWGALAWCLGRVLRMPKKGEEAP